MLSKAYFRPSTCTFSFYLKATFWTPSNGSTFCNYKSSMYTNWKGISSFREVSLLIITTMLHNDISENFERAILAIC